MSHLTAGRLIAAYPGGAVERAVLGQLALHMNHRNPAQPVCPSVRKLARLTGHGMTYVRIALDTLKAEGWITAVGNRKGGRGKTTSWRVNVAMLDHYPDRTKSASKDAGEPDQASEAGLNAPTVDGLSTPNPPTLEGLNPPPVGGLTDKPTKSRGNTHQNPRLNPPTVGDEQGFRTRTREDQQGTPPPATATADSDQNKNVVVEWFEKFFKSFPKEKQQYRKKALAAWIELNPSAELAVHIRKAVRANVSYNPHWDRHYGESAYQYVPFPHNWLKEERWTDTLPRSPFADLDVT